MKKTLRITIIITSIILCIILGTIFLLVNNKNKHKPLDITDVNTMLTNYYGKEGLLEILDIPLMTFGVLDEYESNAFVMSNFDPMTFDTKELEYDPLMVVFVGGLDKDSKKICLDNIEGYLHGMKRLYENDKKVTKLLNKSVINSDDDYVYLIIGKNYKTVLEEIERLREK